MPALNAINCQSAEEFLARVRRSNDDWWESDSHVSSWVFRGVGDAETWKLVPSAWRSEQNGLEPLIDRIASMKLPTTVALQGFADEPSPELRRYDEWVAAEAEALYQFACAANELGFAVDPGSYQRNRSPIAARVIGPGRSFDSVGEVAVTAQHHGIPTRFLDWSGNPMVAAFFAATPLCRPAASKTLGVWALDTRHLTHQGPEEKQFGRYQVLIHRPPRSTNHFLHSQGAFAPSRRGRCQGQSESVDQILRPSAARSAHPRNSAYQQRNDFPG